jgi:ATP-dependent DNA helicase RecG
MEYVETSMLELKEAVTNFNDIAKAACGFANAEGGKIVVGVTSKGIVTGVPAKEIDALQQRIDGAIQTVSPAPFHKIEVLKADGKSVISVEIYKIGEGAFCTHGGIVYYRFGTTIRKLEGKTLQDFLIHRKILSFDESRSEATIADLDDARIADYVLKRTPEFVYNSKNKADVLSNLGVIKKNGDVSVKNTAVLLFAKEPARFFPQNEMKLARFKRTIAVEIIDSKFIHKTLLENLAEANEFVRRNTKTRFSTKGLERTEVGEYPDKVVREALANALVHRDYFSKDATQLNIFDDRLEIINPGGLPQGLSMKMLGTLSIQRNPLIYRLLRDIRLVEGLATGIPRMRQGMLEQNLPEPVFEDLGSFFKVTLYNAPAGAQSLSSVRQQKALHYLQKNKSITSQTYATITGVSRVTAIKDIQDMIHKKVVRKVGTTRSAYYVLAQTS